MRGVPAEDNIVATSSPFSSTTRTCLAHAAIAFLFETIAEDPVLGPLSRPVARAFGVNGSMLEVMTKARARFLAKRSR